MTIGTFQDLVLYNPEMQSGITDVLEQRDDIMRGASNGTIRILTENTAGEFEREAFFKNVEDLVGYRDPADTSEVADKKLEQSELVSVKVNGGIRGTAQTLDSFRKMGETPEVMSFVLGQQAGKGIALHQLNAGLLAAGTAMSTVPGMVYDIVASDKTTKTMNADNLNDALRLMGDAAERIQGLVMHSNTYRDLVGSQIADNLTGLTDMVVRGAVPASMGKPVYVTDSASLIIADGVSSGVPAYRTLALTQDAVSIKLSEGLYAKIYEVSGHANLFARLQGEFAYTLSVKNFQWVGAAAPDASILANVANWSYQFDDVKSGPGIVIVSA